MTRASTTPASTRPPAWPQDTSPRSSPRAARPAVALPTSMERSWSGRHRLFGRSSAEVGCAADPRRCAFDDLHAPSVRSAGSKTARRQVTGRRRSDIQNDARRVRQRVAPVDRRPTLRARPSRCGAGRGATRSCRRMAPRWMSSRRRYAPGAVGVGPASVGMAVLQPSGTKEFVLLLSRSASSSARSCAVEQSRM